MSERLDVGDLAAGVFLGLLFGALLGDTYDGCVRHPCEREGHTWACADQVWLDNGRPQHVESCGCTDRGAK